MFKLEEICEELSQIQIPMRAEELESIGIHVEEEASAEEAERFQDGYLRDVHSCLAERRRHGCRAVLVRPAATRRSSKSNRSRLISSGSSLILGCLILRKNIRN